MSIETDRAGSVSPIRQFTRSPLPRSLMPPPASGCYGLAQYGTLRGVVFVIEDLELDPDRFELSRGGERVRLEPQAFEVLVYLVSHRERVVSKEELMDSIWGGRFVTEAAVTSRIKQVRRALGDDGDAQRLIRTIHGRGYRFVGAVEPAPEPGTPPTAGAVDPGAPSSSGNGQNWRRRAELPRRRATTI